MAFALDTQARIPTTASSTSTATTLSIGYICGDYVGALIVFPIWAGTTARTGGEPTYAGSPLTQVLTQQTVTETSIESWYMLSPPSGSHTLSIPNDGGRTMWVDIASAKSTSASLTFALDSTSSSATTAANPGVTITTVAAPTMIWVGVGTGDNTWSPTGLSGSATYNDDIGSYGGGVQYAVKTATGAQRISWTDSTSDDYNILAVAFKEVARNFSSSVTNDATQAQTAENVTLTYNAPPAALVVNDATQAQTADTVNLSAYYILSSVKDATQLQTAENVTVTFYFTLIISDATQTQTSDNVTLTQHQILTVNDAVQTQTSDNVSLSAYYILSSVKDATQSQTSDNAVLSAYYTLTVQDATQAQTSDNVSLSAYYILSNVQDATQVQTSDNIGLTQHQVLTINDATQIQTSDNVALSAHYTLTSVKDTEQAQTTSTILTIMTRTNGARDFNGTTDRIDWTSKAVLTASALTISAWFKHDTSPSGDYIFTAHTAGDTGVGIILYLLTEGGFDGSIILYRHGSTYTYRMTRRDQYKLGEWTHVLATHDGTFSQYNTMHIYVNGVECSYYTGSNGSSEIAPSGSWSIGGRIYSDTLNFDGKIAEVAVWNRVLNSSEIALLASRSPLKSGTYIPSGLLFCAHPDEPKDLWTGEIGTLDGTTLINGPDLDFPDYSLTVQDSTQAQTSDNITLSAHYTLTSVQDSTQVQTSDNVTVTYNSGTVTLIVNNATQLQTSNSYFSDDFTDSDWTTLPNHNSNWKTNNNWAIHGNVAYPDFGEQAWWNIPTDDNQFSQFKLVTGGSPIAVIVRYSTGTETWKRNLYCFYSGSASSYIGKIVDWTSITPIGASAVRVPDGATMRLEVSGSTLTPYVNGTIWDSGIQYDNSITSGKAGIMGTGNYPNTSGIDDWVGGNLNGNIILGAHYTLTVQDATQLQTSENVELTQYQTGTLTVQDSTQEQKTGFIETFTDGYGGNVNTATDSFLREDDPTTGYPNSVVITFNSASGYRSNGLLKFNVSSLSGYIISSATLHLFIGSYCSAGTIVFHSILSANSAITFVNGCSWNHSANNVTHWAGDTGGDHGTDAGCSVSSVDYNANTLGQIVVTAGAAGREFDTNLDINEVQTWIDSANYGIVGVSADASDIGLASSENTTVEWRPKLVVQYLAPLVLTQNYALTVDNATQAQTADNISLSAHYSLTVNDATQLQTAENISLTQHGIILTYNHETGTFSEYDSHSPNCTITTDAAMGGTNYGMSVDVSVGGYAYKQLSSIVATTKLRYRFYIDLNTTSIIDGNNFGIYYNLMSLGSFALRDITKLGNSGGNYYLVVDIGGYGWTNTVVISNKPHWIEIYETLDGSNSNIKLWVDDVLKTDITDNAFSYKFTQFDCASWGQDNAPSGTTGIMYLDELVVNDTGEYIGPKNCLIVDDATQGQTSDNTSLNANYSLSVDNATQTQTADNISLSAHYSITVSDAVQAQIADSVFLAAFYVLIMNNATQAHTSENITLSTGGLGITKQMMHYVRLRSR